MASSVDLVSSFITWNEIVQKTDEHDIPDLLNRLSDTQRSIIAFLSDHLPTPDDNDNNNKENNTTVDGGGSSKNINKKTNDSRNNNSTNGSGSNNNNNSSLNQQIEKLQRDFSDVKDAFDRLKKFEDHVSDQIKVVLRRIYDNFKEVTEAPEVASQTQLRKLNLIVTKLKVQLSSEHKISSASSDANGHMWWNPSRTRIAYKERPVFVELPNLHTSEHFLHSSAFKDIREIYESLDNDVKCCLLCFAAFPENVVVKKRLLLYWWIGEDLVVPSGTSEKTTAEDVAEDVLKKLMVTGFIGPVNKKKRMLVVDSFKMHPFFRSAVITFAQEAGFFDFDTKGTPTMNFSSCHRACLVKLERGSSPPQVHINSPNLDHGKLHTLFNVSEPYLGFELDWFTKIKNVKVLYLGRWQCSAKHHIEVDDTEFLKGLKHMKQLKFFSLQGISRINELPNSISRLTNLRILDLRACHNLEVLPDGIGSLKNLTYLDMSECYLLSHMPKGLAFLSQLQVLKGFVIGDSKGITLNDLGKLKKLRKLSISTSLGAFPTNKELTALQQFEALRKLTIAWGGRSFHHQDKKDNSAKQEIAEPGTTNPDHRGDEIKQETTAVDQPVTRATTTRKLETIKTLSKSLTFKSKSVPVITTLPMALEKLDLQCFPQTKTPSWLMPDKLQSLKKLYIRGGNLRGLGKVEEGNEGWKVEVLRLKFLGEMKMDWREVQALFPKLIYLEKVKCPKLTFFPCDESGVWLN